MSEMTPTGARFAIYFAPPVGSPLHAFGSACLGREVVSGEARPYPVIDGLTSDRWRRIAASPSIYGFHATLKPPFRLAGGRTRLELVRALEQFAAARTAFTAPPLRVARISNFLALVLRDDSPAFSELADACVRGFDFFRAAPSL